ncbi:Malto-oligosyltrehalose trehalohydrolase [Acidisarcina polymorpha]|uniref:Malto-oligosyltrehalose trehalohydrolase n=1 Tax=Acidisarcina polymorpha TaxID=2211140 RepID=A0A2Z5FY83_9BACT|nr:malto-oligosyltrehalose trehalohydrolase [Acidisarcina polymorpha]AXC11821.1 Malto-oligosyltrehalose trehalohydrolase [Acidisarcina polymorpha]
MYSFRVWAPVAKKVEVKTGDQKTELQAQDGGWWQAEVATAGPGTDYAYIIDGEEPAVPDPRSMWQPEGIHGPSRVLDHAAFAWSDSEWRAPAFSSAIVYELHVGTFTPEGTFDAVIDHLDYLKDLGVTHVEILPVAAFPGKRGWGYDGVDLFAPYEPYGGPEGLKRLVDAAHRKGLAMVLDVVYNHFGPDGNYSGKFAPYLTSLHTTPWGDAVNFEEGGSHEVRRFFIENALMWMRDYHFDGLRLDAVTAYMDRSATHFLEELAREVRELEAETGRILVLIAESDLNDPKLVKAPEAGGYGVDAAWSDDFHHALVTFLTGDRSGYYVDFGALADLAKALESVYVYDGSYSEHRDRHHGRPVCGLPGWRFLGYSQNHDQVGNRARGERLVHLVGEKRARIAAALVITAPFVPMLFQGEEFAASAPFQYFTDHEEELGHLVSAGRKREFTAFGWKPEQIPDPQAEATFTDSKLEWKEVTEGAHSAMLDWYKQLIHLRKTTPELVNGRLDDVIVSVDEDDQWLVMDRGTIQVACNFGAEPLQIELPSGSTLLLGSDEVALKENELTLPPDGVSVVRVS